MVTAWSQMWGVYLAAAFEHVLPEFRDRMDPKVVAIIEQGQKMDAVAFKRLEEVRTRQWFALADLYETFDALLCPTMALPAPPADDNDDDHERIDAQGRLHGLDMTSIFNNVSECPALSVPSGWTADGLPTGAQIIGRRFDDPTVLRIGAAVELNRPWRHRRPPLPQP
jgi:Asp-tRNA(Asn)/Glu-tRNA(Gln) amidotransferase A subunit family amidase